MKDPCPQLEVLEELIAGDLSGESLSMCETHVETCTKCQRSLDTLFSSHKIPPAIARPNAGDPWRAEIAERLHSRLCRSLAVSAASLNTPPLPTIPGYKVEGLLGRGGMGSVYKAYHKRLGCHHAIKILPDCVARNSEFADRFDREVDAIGQLQHRHIVRAINAAEHQGTRYLVMELLHGRDVSRILKDLGPLRIADACEIVRQSALGIQIAYERGIVHRDVKPSNLMLAMEEDGPPKVKVLDLGLALLADQHQPIEDLTRAGQVMGTLEYMAPEQGKDSHRVDIRADIYSLGCTLYKLLCGEGPFPASQYDTPLKMILAVATTSPPSIAEKCTLPAGLAKLIDRMISHDPEDRPSTPEAVASALVPYAEDNNLQAVLTEATRRLPDETAVDHSAPTSLVPGQFPHMATSDVSNHVSNHDNLESPQHGRRIGMLLGSLLLGSTLLAPGLVFFFQTANGTVRIEVNDPKIEVSLKDGVFLFTEQNKNQFTMEPGEHQMLIKRNDLEFETVQFIVRNGKQTAIRIEYLKGRLGVVNNGNTVFPAIVKAPVVQLPTARTTKQATWQRGSNENVLIRGLIPSPAEIPGIKRWQIYVNDGDVVGSRVLPSPDGRYIGRVIDLGREHARLHWPAPELRVYESETGTLRYLSPIKINEGFSPVWSSDSQSLAIDGEHSLRNLDGTRGASIESPVRGETWNDDCADVLQPLAGVPRS